MRGSGCKFVRLTLETLAVTKGRIPLDNIKARDPPDTFRVGHYLYHITATLTLLRAFPCSAPPHLLEGNSPKQTVIDRYTFANNGDYDTAGWARLDTSLLQNPEL